jgi:hypothetical protein
VGVAHGLNPFRGLSWVESTSSLGWVESTSGLGWVGVVFIKASMEWGGLGKGGKLFWVGLVLGWVLAH